MVMNLPRQTNALLGLSHTPPDTSVLAAAEVVRRLELVITRRLDGLLHGDHLGLTPGHGSEPGETREYEPGDDVRRIDWNVTARTGRPHVRITEADRELTAHVVVDLSASMDFGTAACRKRDLAIAAAATVVFLTARMGNRIGAWIVHPAGLTAIPPAGGSQHARALVHTFVSSPRSDGPTPISLQATLDRLGAVASRAGLVAIVSDFLDPSPWENSLKRLSATSELLAVEILDPRELELPDVGVIEVVDPESGETLEVQTSDRRLRQLYAEAAQRHRESIARAFRRAGADHLILATDSDWILDVVRFVATRRERLAAVRSSRK